MKRGKLGIVSIFIVVTSVIIVFTSIYYNNTIRVLTNRMLNELTSIGNLKIDQISRWYVDELHDAHVVSENPVLLEIITEWQKKPSELSAQKVQKYLHQLCLEHDLDEAFVLNLRDNKQIGSGLSLQDFNPKMNPFVSKVIQSRQTQASDLMLCEHQNKLHIHFFAPIVDSFQVVAVLVFHISPDQYLFPIVHNWPNFSETSEAILVREEGDSLLLMSPTRFRDIQPLTQRISQKINTPSTGGGTILLRGTSEWVDYRNEQVISYANAIAGTNWFLVCKIDRDEIFKMISSKTWSIFTIALLLIVFAGVLLSMIYNIKERNMYKAVLQAQKIYRTTLYSIGDAVITTSSTGEIVNMNPVAEQLTGYREKEVVGMKLSDIFKIFNEETLKPVESPVDLVLAKGNIVGLANHTILRSKQGVEIPIADSGAPIFDETGKIDGVVLVFRDQTVERQQQKDTEESRRRLLTLMSNLKGIVYRCLNDARYTMKFLSESCYEITGYTPEELILNNSLPYSALIHPCDLECVTNEINQSVLQRKHFEIEYRIVTKSKKVKWVLEQGLGVHSETGELVALEGYITDITDRIEAKIQLKQSEEKYKYLFVNNPLPMWIYDLQTLRFLMVNAAAIEQYGYTNEEFLSLTLTDIRPQEDLEKFEHDVSSTTKMLNNAGVWRHVKKDGEIIHVEIISHRLEFEGKDARLVSAHNISKRKIAEEALMRSEEQYRSLFEDHSAVKIMVEPETGQIVNANLAAAHFYGWSVEELKQKNIAEINTLTSDEIKRTMSKAIKRQRNYFEFKHRLANGQIRDVEIFTSNIVFEGKNYLHSIIHDVTERKKAEEQLKLLSLSVEQTPVSILITNSQGAIEYINPQLTKVTGYSLPEVIGRNPRMFSSKQLDNAFYKHMWTTILKGEIWQGEFLNRRKNGETYWEKSIIAPISNDDGAITHFVAIREDVTEKRKLIQDLISAKTQAEESERLKSSFLANMSHEIRTPLNSILGFSNFLANEDDLTSDEKEQYTNIINKSAEGLLQIISDIIDISSLETGQMKMNFQPIKMNSFLRSIHTQMLSRLQTAGKSAIQINYISHNDFEFVTDEIRLGQIFNNLLVNAIKFTESGQINFGIEDEKPDGVVFVVSDTGIGIEDDKKEVIFQRFRQIENAETRHYGGNGLGLSIVKHLIDLMHGSIEVESTVGKGTAFRFFLPCLDA
jgi:PAS domain S-box-containing protein